MNTLAKAGIGALFLGAAAIGADQVEIEQSVTGKDIWWSESSCDNISNDTKCISSSQEQKYYAEFRGRVTLDVSSQFESEAAYYNFVEEKIKNDATVTATYTHSALDAIIPFSIRGEVDAKYATSIDFAPAIPE